MREFLSDHYYWIIRRGSRYYLMTEYNWLHISPLRSPGPHTCPRILSRRSPGPLTGPLTSITRNTGPWPYVIMSLCYVSCVSLCGWEAVCVMYTSPGLLTDWLSSLLSHSPRPLPVSGLRSGPSTTRTPTSRRTPPGPSTWDLLLNRRPHDFFCRALNIWTFSQSRVDGYSGAECFRLAGTAAVGIMFKVGRKERSNCNIL